MKTALIKQAIDFKIITGFSKLPIDPELSRLRNKVALENLPEAAPVNEKIAAKNGLNQRVKQCQSKVRRAKFVIDNHKAMISAKPEVKEQIMIDLGKAQSIFPDESKKFDQFHAQLSVIDQELSEANRVYDEAIKKYKLENLVYSHPRANEVMLTADQFSEISQAFIGKSSNEQISIKTKTVQTSIKIGDGEEIKGEIQELVSFEKVDDFRGKQYFFHDGQSWIDSEVITSLGVTKETVVVDEFQDQAIEKADLSEVQAAEIRVQFLSDEEKEAEKQAAIKLALKEAASMRSELEISDKTAAKALSESKEWYSKQLILIEAKYA